MVTMVEPSPLQPLSLLPVCAFYPWCDAPFAPTCPFPTHAPAHLAERRDHGTLHTKLYLVRTPLIRAPRGSSLPEAPRTSPRTKPPPRVWPPRRPRPPTALPLRVACCLAPARTRRPPQTVARTWKPLRAALRAPLIKFIGDIRYDGYDNDIGDAASRRKINFMGY